MKTRFPSQSITTETSYERWEISGGNGRRLGDVIFLRLPDVKAITGLSKTSLYELIKAKDFPAPIRLAPRAVAWIKSEIERWAEERVLASRSHPEHLAGKRTVHRVSPEPNASSKKLA